MQADAKHHNWFFSSLIGKLSCGLMLFLMPICTSHAAAHKAKSPVAGIHHPSAALKPSATVISKLSNGLNVMIRPDHRAPVVMVNMLYAVGAADEPANLRGVSHALEHMMFKGTIKVPNSEFSQLSHYFGGSINAVTAHHYTSYTQRYGTAQLEMALELEADRMQHLQIRPAEFAQEQQVILAERRQRISANPNGQVQAYFRQLSYDDSPLALSILGDDAEINALNSQKIQQWYNLWYAPNNAYLVIVGDVDVKQTLIWVKRYFGGIAPKTVAAQRNINPLQAPKPMIAAESTAKTTPISDKIQANIAAPTLYLSWKVPCLSASNKDLTSTKTTTAHTSTIATATTATSTPSTSPLSLSLLQFVLASRLPQGLSAKLIQQQPILQSVSVSYDPIQRLDSQPNSLNCRFNISAIPQKNVSLATAQAAILGQLQQRQQQTFTDTDFALITQALQSQWRYEQDDLSQVSYELGRLSVNGLDANWLDTRSRVLAQLQSTALQQVIAQYLQPKNSISLMVMPNTSGTKNKQKLSLETTAPLANDALEMP